MTRRSHSMNTANWQALAGVARSCGCVGRDGLPSWRVLVRRIAAGEIVARLARSQCGKIMQRDGKLIVTGNFEPLA